MRAVVGNFGGEVRAVSMSRVAVAQVPAVGMGPAGTAMTMHEAEQS